MAIDDKLTEKIKAWIDAAPEERDTELGAVLLLKCTRNRILAANFARRPEKMMSKAVYELRKHLSYRLQGKTLGDVARMDKTLMPQAEEIVKRQRGAGKRPDHDRLPPQVQALWEDNDKLWRDIRLLFEQLKQMEDAPACDRWELLHQLDEKEKRHRANFEAYDAAAPAEALPGEAQQDTQP